MTCSVGERYSWIFLPFGLWAARRNPKALLIGSVVISLVLVYMSYWIGATLFGPRYYYEGLFSLTLFSAAGIAWLAGWPISRAPHSYAIMAGVNYALFWLALIVGRVGGN